MQKHWDVMRSDDAGESWHEVSGDLPTDFGLTIGVHAHEPETVYVVPIKSDSEHFPPDGKLRVYRSRTGGNAWEPLVRGLPQKDCYVDVLRDAMAVDRLDPCGVYFGTTGGQVYAAADGGDTWAAIATTCRPSCPSRSRRCRDPDRAPRPAAGVGAPGGSGARLDALEARYPVLRGTVRDSVTQRRRAFLRFFACGRDCRWSRPTPRCPRPSRRLRTPYGSWGRSPAARRRAPAMAGAFETAAARLRSPQCRVGGR
jgi:hypothetical protein